MSKPIAFNSLTVRVTAVTVVTVEKRLGGEKVEWLTVKYSNWCKERGPWVMSIVAVAKNRNEFSWSWKDSNRRWWSLLSHPTGDLRNQNAHNPEGDWVWCYHLFNELGEMIWEGEFVGQLDCVPKLRWLLEEWQKDVASAVIDGVAFEASGRK